MKKIPMLIVFFIVLVIVITGFVCVNVKQHKPYVETYEI